MLVVGACSAMAEPGDAIVPDVEMEEPSVCVLHGDCV